LFGDFFFPFSFLSFYYLSGVQRVSLKPLSTFPSKNRVFFSFSPFLQSESASASFPKRLVCSANEFSLHKSQIVDSSTSASWKLLGNCERHSFLLPFPFLRISTKPDGLNEAIAQPPTAHKSALMQPFRISDSWGSLGSYVTAAFRTTCAPSADNAEASESPAQYLARR